MKKSVKKLIQKYSAVTVWIQTVDAIRNSQALKAKLVGQVLVDHLQSNTDRCERECTKKYENTRAGQRHRLKAEWEQYVAMYAPACPFLNNQQVQEQQQERPTEPETDTVSWGDNDGPLTEEQLRDRLLQVKESIEDFSSLQQ